MIVGGDIRAEGVGPRGADGVRVDGIGGQYDGGNAKGVGGDGMDGIRTDGTGAEVMVARGWR